MTRMMMAWIWYLDTGRGGGGEGANLRYHGASQKGATKQTTTRARAAPGMNSASKLSSCLAFTRRGTET